MRDIHDILDLISEIELKNKREVEIKEMMNQIKNG